mgnify:CR=1 FL=1
MVDEAGTDEDISMLLQRAQRGNSRAREQLFDVIYQRLLNIARGQMRNERDDHSLGATGLVNEAWMKLEGVVDSVENRRQLFSAAAQAMRRVLIDHARKRRADKRFGKLGRRQLDDVLDHFQSRIDCDLIDLDSALTKLDAESPRQRELIELKFFAEQTIAQMAQHLGVSEATVESDWRLARAKLYRWLETDEQRTS